MPPMFTYNAEQKTNVPSKNCAQTEQSFIVKLR